MHLDLRGEKNKNITIWKEIQIRHVTEGKIGKYGPQGRSCINEGQNKISFFWDDNVWSHNLRTQHHPEQKPFSPQRFQGVVGYNSRVQKAERCARADDVELPRQCESYFLSSTECRSDGKLTGC